MTRLAALRDTLSPGVRGALFYLLAGARLEEGPVVEQQARRPLRELGRDPALVVLLVATFLIGAALGISPCCMTFASLQAIKQ